MRVKGSSRVENLIEGTITVAELATVVRAVLALPKDVEIQFGVELGASIDDQDNPLRFTARWRQETQGAAAQIAGVELIERAVQLGKPAPYVHTDPRGEPVHPNR